MTTFAITALLLIMLPAPDQALITRNALVGGRSGGALTMLGGALGLTEHAVADRSGPVGALGRFGEDLHCSQDRGCALPRLAADPRAARRCSVQPIFRGGRRAECGAPALGVLAAGLLVERTEPQGGTVLRDVPAAVPPHGRRVYTRAGAASLGGLGQVLPDVFSVYVASVEHLGRWLRRPRGRARVEQVTGSSAALTRPLVRATQPRPERLRHPAGISHEHHQLITNTGRF